MRHRYSKIEDEFLIKNVRGITLKKLTEIFNRNFNCTLSESAIANRKTKLNIRSGIVGGQFQKGRVPYNKGKKWSEYMSEEGQKNSRKTTFKKGNVPANCRTIGSERTNERDGILIKIRDGYKTRNWIAKSRYVYEQVYGKIPKGYMVIFADGNNRNFDLSNLVLVSNAELLLLNQHRLIKNDADLTKTGVMVAKMLDKVNKRKK